MNWFHERNFKQTSFPYVKYVLKSAYEHWPSKCGCSKESWPALGHVAVCYKGAFAQQKHPPSTELRGDSKGAQ